MAAAATAGLLPAALSMMSAVRAAQGDMIHHFTWSACDVPEVHQPPSSRSKGTCDRPVFASAEDRLQKIQAGFTADLAHPFVDNVPRRHDSGAIQQLDMLRIDDWGNMFPALHSMNGAVIDGDVYMAITEFGPSSMFCRADIHEGEETWSMLFDEHNAGLICTIQGSANIPIALKLFGREPVNPTVEQVHQATERTRKQRPLVRSCLESQFPPPPSRPSCCRTDAKATKSSGCAM